MQANAITASQAQKIDYMAIHRFGMPSVAMMENAGRAVALLIDQRFKKLKPATICVVCGPGNNGGDGLVITRYLINLGFFVKVFLIGQPSQLTEDARINYGIIKKMKADVTILTRITLGFLATVQQADLIVDAIFGIGLNRDIKEPFLSIIQAINQSRQKVFSVDVPSGLDATTGKTHSACVRANGTITFVLPKKGFFCNEGPRFCGRVHVVDIGIPSMVIQKVLL